MTDAEINVVLDENKVSSLSYSGTRDELAFSRKGNPVLGPANGEDGNEELKEVFDILFERLSHDLDEGTHYDVLDGWHRTVLEGGKNLSRA